MQRLAPGSRPRWRVGVFLATSAIFALSLVASILDPLPAGLRGAYFESADWTGRRARPIAAAVPSAYALILAWRGVPPPILSATWTGSILIAQGGAYTFGVSTQGGAALYIEDRLIVDNRSRDHAQPATGTIELSRGTHRLLLTYSQSGGPLELDFLWSRDGASLRPVPARVLAPRPISFVRLLASSIVRFVAATAVWPWLAAAAWFVAGATLGVFRRALAAQDFIGAIEWGLLLVGAALLLFVMPHQISSDAWVRYFGLAKLIEWRELSSTYYSFVGPLGSAPLYFLGKLIRSPQWWCERYNAILFVGGLCALWQVLRKRLDARLFRRFALVIMAASMFPNHVQDYFGEVFTAVLVSIGLMAVQGGRPLVGWATAVLGVINTPATLAGLFAAAGLRTSQTRRLRHLTPVAIAAVLIGVEAFVRRGSAFDSRYVYTAGNRTVLTYSGVPGFSYPLFFGLLSILFSFGKGIIFYAPGLLLLISRRLRTSSVQLFPGYELWIAFLAGIVLIYAKWWAWFGGWAWGPRFFLIASVPASCTLAVALHHIRDVGAAVRASTLAVLTLSAWVAIDGVLFGLAALDVCANDTFASLCWYVPEFSPLWRPFVQFTPPSPSAMVVGAFIVVVYGWLAAPVVRSLAPVVVEAGASSWRTILSARWRL